MGNGLEGTHLHYHFHFGEQGYGAAAPVKRKRGKRGTRRRRNKVIHEGPRKGLFYCIENGKKIYLDGPRKELCINGRLENVKSGCYPPKEERRNVRKCDKISEVF